MGRLGILRPLSEWIGNTSYNRPRIHTQFFLKDKEIELYCFL